MVLSIVVLAQVLRLPGQRLLLLHLISAMSTRLKHKSELPELLQGKKWVPVATPDMLHAVGRHHDVVEAIQHLKPGVRTSAMNVLMARALFELGEFERARAILTNSGGEEAFDFEPSTAHLRGLLELCAGNEREADMALRSATANMSHLMAPHQNLAAKNPMDYRPTRLDAAAGRDGRLFDAYNYLGQRVTHVGMGHLSTGLYAKAFEAQKRLQENTPPVSRACASYLTSLGISLSDVKVFASEWQTQIGHLGMLDIQLRMRELGWWSGEPVVLVDERKVANFAFLSLFEHRARLLALGRNAHRSISDELGSLQRYRGLSFNAFDMPDGSVVQWSEAAALAMRCWDDEGREPPLRMEYDRKFGASETLAGTLRHARASWGMKPDDWYVCLHLRDGAFYGEAKGLGQSHRNSNFENYRTAIEYITGLGGWVIKLGAKDSPKIPRMPRVIDYGRSAFKSGLMDISLIRGARLFIGTTSGLTNVATSFGIPAALVNCISTDAQLWHGQTRFTPKRIVLENGRALTQAELTQSPWRWRQFDAGVLARHGAVPFDNTPDEILEAVKEVMALATGNAEDYDAAVETARDLLSRWQETLSVPHYYGAAQISLYYLKKHRATLLLASPHASHTEPEPLV
ncbi:TIGR04372 family glycosyltransferase [Bradyrhizobium diazoefficiens]|nr:TIGR04372 family glycosyltransferase [Bradyrhizobium diazoefficiens]MBR0848964.1 TIGR04372 family glycosyltransferase [Bradyrhizobium diazoefficiens]